MIKPLLTSKLYTPDTETGIINRERLTNLLNESLHNQFTIITAPAGYGKTTLLSQWAKTHIGEVAWLSLDENDNDINRFWFYFTNAINSFGLNIDENLITGPKSLGLQLDLYITLSLKKISELDSCKILILDDFQVIANNRILKTFKIFLDNLALSQQNHFHMVISSRTKLGFSIARFRSQDKLCELSASDLQFSLQETQTFLEKHYQSKFSSNSVIKIDKYLEGWVTGMKLLTLSVPKKEQIHEFIDLLPSSKKYIWEYLFDEILNKQPEDIRIFLLRTSILEQLSVGLCNAVTERKDSNQILERIAKDNLFISPVDNNGKWYRYHTVFRDFLSDRLEKDYKKIIASLHIKASEWYRQESDLPDSTFVSLDHIFKAKDYKAAEEILLDVSLLMIFNGECYRLNKYLSMMPQDVLTRNHWLALYKGWSLFINGSFDLSEQLLLGIENFINKNDDLNPNDRQKLHGYIAAIRAQIMRERGNFIESLHLSYRAYYNLIDDQKEVKALVTLNLGNCYLKIGNLSKAKIFFTESHYLCKEVGNYSASLSTFKRLGDIQFFKGDLQEAEKIFKMGITLGEQWGKPNRPLFYTAMIYPRLGLIEYERDQLENAQEYFEKGKQLGEQSNIPTLLFASYLGLAQVNIAKNNICLCKTQIKHAERLLKFSVDTIDRNWYQAIQFKIYKKINNPLLIKKWIDDQKIDITDTPTLDQESVYTSLIKAYLYQRKFRFVYEHIERLLRKSRNDNRSFLIVETLILSSIVNFNLNNLEQAINEIITAMDLAKTYGYQRIFLDESQLLSGLIEIALNTQPKKVDTNLAQLILQNKNEKDRFKVETIEELSEREIIIINLVSSGLTNQEIADKLFLTLGTVKWHLSNIFGKLQVKNRVQAIEIVRKKRMI